MEVLPCEVLSLRILCRVDDFPPWKALLWVWPSPVKSFPMWMTFPWEGLSHVEGFPIWRLLLCDGSLKILTWEKTPHGEDLHMGNAFTRGRRPHRKCPHMEKTITWETLHMGELFHGSMGPMGQKYMWITWGLPSHEKSACMGFPWRPMGQGIVHGIFRLGMACENLSNYFSNVMKFSGYLLF